MLETITRQFVALGKRLRGQARLTEENIQTSLSQIRDALLDADVALPVIDKTLADIKQKALGAEVAKSLNPGQAFLRIVYDALVAMMGSANAPLNIKKPPAIVLGCGLQGVGKTTNLAKLALHLRTKMKKRTLLASCDIRRPAAIEQLRILAESAGVAYFESDEMSDAGARAQAALARARQELFDVLLIDTAGRTTLDDEMMREIAHLHELLNPAETLFFIDAMQGQDAVNTARAFHQTVALTGLALTKFDGDSRGGAALSAVAVTEKPIKFVGVGEKIDDLEVFYPDRYASRILGMGDISSLAEQIVDKADVGEMKKFEKKMMRKPHTYDLNDQLKQIQQIQKMGGAGNIFDKLPKHMTARLQGGAFTGEGVYKQMSAMILSMTPDERRMPEVIKSSRKRRIAAGAGVAVSAVNRLLDNHEATKKIFKKHAKNPLGMARVMQKLMQGRG